MLGQLYRNLLKPILFLLKPETAHEVLLRVGAILGRLAPGRWLVRKLFYYANSKLQQSIWGVEFANPVGLSAGFDKDGYLVQILPDLGFGFMQVGTVTYKPYAGNPGRWLYRLKRSKALIVYYGLRNQGVRRICERIKLSSRRFPISMSIGKTNHEYTKEIDAGAKDYADCLEYAANQNCGDIFTINISCPNTFGGEPFTTPDRLRILFDRLSQLEISKPLLVKMPLNLPWEEFRDLLDLLLEYEFVRGVVIANLTKDRTSEDIKDYLPELPGGISGRPTFDLSNELISQTYGYCGDRLKIVGVGGIFSAADAYEKICRGASLVQMITGMIYEGPQVVGEINRGLVKLLEADGYSDISQAVGSKQY